MPTYSVTREQRIMEIVQNFTNSNDVNFNKLLNFAYGKYPTVSESTIKSYCRASLRILENTKNA